MTHDLTMPPHIAAAGIAGKPIDFAWDETNTRQYYFGRTSDQLANKIIPISPRGQIALAAGIAEWIVWRFEGMSDFIDVRDYVAAAWTAVIDFRYATGWVAPSDRPLTGPILKSQWIAALTLDDVVRTVQERSPSEFEVGYVAFFANHVVGRHRAYKAWLEQVMKRLAELSPLPETTREWYETTDHTPEQIAEFDWGIPVPREALDTTREYDMARAPADFDAFLRSLDPSRNRFLLDAATLREHGMARPYTYAP